jgi:hypothetical protein
MAQFLKTTTTTAGPTPLSSTLLTCRKFSLIAAKGLNGPSASPNAGVVFIGQSATAGQQPIEMSPGDERSFGDANGPLMDLSKFYLTVATSGDGVVVIYH